MKPTILSIGEIIWDVYPESREIGGAPLNFAAHCAICGAESRLVSAVGNDQLGEEALAFLARVGIDTRFVETVDAPTGKEFPTIALSPTLPTTKLPSPPLCKILRNAALTPAALAR